MSESEKGELKCFACSIKLNPKNKLTSPPSKPLVELICSMLSRDSNDDSEDCSNLCRKCHKHFEKVHKLQLELAQAKSQILDTLKAQTNREEETEIVLEDVEHQGEDDDAADIVENYEEPEIIPEEHHEEEFFAIEIPANEDVETIEITAEKSPKKKTVKKSANAKDDSPQEQVVERKDDTYACLLCTEDFVGGPKDIISHFKDFHDMRLYICDVCGQEFRKRNELSNHLDEHVANEQGDFQCDVCNRIFDNLRLYRIHKRIHYPQVKSWSCDTCDKSFNSKNLLSEHMNVHTGNRPYVCATCGKDFASKYTFSAHKRTHEVRARPYECKQCDKTFLSQQNLSQHLKTHSGVKDFVCDTCGKAFATQHNLDVHNIVHTGYKPFICKSCGKAFARKAEIRDHERIHTGEKPYQCEYCGSTFSQRSNLQSHKRATHFQDKRYKCDDCGKGFKRRRLLDYHIKAAHTGERPYKCETCSATFVYPEHFKKHLRIHTGEKPYLCEVCGKAFNSRDNRNAHRFIHSDKKPYECLVCGVGFMRKPLLYAHMQTQGHINDTIVVNQPRLTTEDEILIQEGGQIQLVMQTDSDQFEDGDVRIIDLKDHIIIGDGDETKFKILQSTELVEEAEEPMSEEVEIEEHETNCKTEVMEEEDDSQFEEETGTIVIPAGTDYEELLENVGNGNVRLVQIQLPTSEGEEEDDKKAWIKLIKK